MNAITTNSTFYKNIILKGIDFSDYSDINPATDKEKINALYDTFISEYGWALKQMSEQRAFKEWLQGLPSCLDIPFMYCDILALAKENGFTFGTRKIEDLFLQRYFTNLSTCFFILKSTLNA